MHDTLCTGLPDLKMCTQQCKTTRTLDKLISEAVLGPHTMLHVIACFFWAAYCSWNVLHVAMQPLGKYLDALTGCPIT